MLLKVVVPAADAAFRAGAVARWHVGEGETIGFGSTLCDIAIDEFVALQRTKRASLLGSASRIRRRRIKDDIDHREGRGQVMIRLRCAETDLVLREIRAPEGGRIAVGSVVALIGTTDAQDDLDDHRLAEARVSVDFPDAEEIDPFE